NRVAVLELYTSEGCSSCPPADEWFSALPKAGFTGDKLIPIAFHVGYWDYIGWKDRFASPLYSQRQKEAVKVAGARVVYTPQVFLNGRDFKARGDNESLANAIRSINQAPARALIKLNLSASEPREWKVSTDIRLNGSSSNADAVAYLGVYENRLLSEVRAGENKGVLLRHDHVIRDWIGPLPLNSGKLEFMRDVALKIDQKAKESGLVALVQDRRTGDVLQSLRLPYCEAK
ncbi:MAG TPA: DUF1223 domain-containing protein, partial [Burkholderiales bacterium]|nr:DUF1223 domain-containing protein [Burkholderiales bacterium]